MARAITNRVLLEHIQAMKGDLQSQITHLGAKMVNIEIKVTNLDQTSREALRKCISAFKHSKRTWKRRCAYK